ncbi:ABC transporter permease, partial [Mycoplasmopsis pullorum]
MEKLKLYNWYGEEFDTVIPQQATSLKAYKKNAKNVFNRRIRAIKIRREIEKDLFLRAKTKIQDNLKRELYSHKVAYLNKVKVVKDSIRKLKIASSVQSLIAFEIKKLTKERKNLAKYAKDYQTSLKNTTDTYEEKVASIQKLVTKTNLDQTQLNLKFIFYNLMLEYIKKFDDLEFDFTKLTNLLEPELEFLKSMSNPKAVFLEAYNEIKKTQERLLAKREELKKQFSLEHKELKTKYVDGKYNIKLSARQRIIQAEYEYNEKYQNSKVEIQEYKKAALAKIEQHKQEILQADKNNQSIVDNLIKQSNNSKQEYKKLYQANLKKVQAKTLSYMLERFKDFVTSDESHLKNLDLNSVATNSLSEIKKSIQEHNKLNDLDTQILKIYVDVFFSHKSYFEHSKIAKLILQSDYAKNLSKSYKSVSHESEYQLVKSQALLEKAQGLNTIIQKYKIEKILAKVEILKLKASNLIQQEKTTNQEKKKAIFDESKELFALYKNKIKSKEITKAAFKNKKIEIKVAEKEKLLELKLNSNLYKNKNILSTNLWRENAEKKIVNKIFESKINEAQKSIPIEINKGIKLWATILGFILPGLPEILFFKQYLKGILMLLFTVFVWSFLIPFSLGFYWSKMNGIPGFYDLGASKFNSQAGSFPDARYYLFGGVISVIFFSISIIYLFISSIGARRVATALEEGSRPSKW